MKIFCSTTFVRVHAQSLRFTTWFWNYVLHGWQQLTNNNYARHFSTTFPQHHCIDNTIKPQIYYNHNLTINYLFCVTSSLWHRTRLINIINIFFIMKISAIISCAGPLAAFLFENKNYNVVRHFSISFWLYTFSLSDLKTEIITSILSFNKQN